MNAPEKLSIEKSVPDRRGVRFAKPSQPASAYLPKGALRQAPRRSVQAAGGLENIFRGAELAGTSPNAPQ